MINECGAVGGMAIAVRKKKYSDKTLPSATLFTTNPILLDVGLKHGRRGR
jgi:hypothetical protein